MAATIFRRTPSPAALLAAALLGFGPRAICEPVQAPAVQPAEAAAASEVAPRNVVLFVADGMGPVQVEAARRFQSGGGRPLFFETLPRRAEVATENADGEVPDSASAATAMATGHKTANSVISVALPGGGADLPTALEILAARGKRTGIVTVDTELTDATPAAFAAHARSRREEPEIAHDILQGTRPHLLVGGASPHLDGRRAALAGYRVVPPGADPAALEVAQDERVAWFLPEQGRPQLADLALFALTALERGPQGYFLLIEHEETDTSGHQNDLAGVVAALLELDAAVQAVVEHVGPCGDTLVLVTSDHETGGLSLDAAASPAGSLPGHRYSHDGHSPTPVPLYAAGPGSRRVAGRLDNTDVFSLLVGEE